MINPYIYDTLWYKIARWIEDRKIVLLTDILLKSMYQQGTDTLICILRKLDHMKISQPSQILKPKGAGLKIQRKKIQWVPHRLFCSSPFQAFRGGGKHS
jgi:hypothetical protein